jgi:hypothetical protein
MVKIASSKSKTITRDLAPSWWGKDACEFSTIDVKSEVVSRLTKDVRFKKTNGIMVLFRKAIYVKIVDGVTINSIDDNNKVCVRIDEEEFDFFNQIQETMQSLMILPRKTSMGHHDSTMKPCVVRSQESDKPYLKAKVQTLGYSRTTGIDVDGKEQLDTPDLLRTPGTKGDFLMRVEGVYITPTDCGVLAKVDMFRLKSLPSEEDREAYKKDKEDEGEEMRKKRLREFMYGPDDAKKAKK